MDSSVDSKKFYRYSVRAVFPDGKTRIFKCDSTCDNLIDFLFEVEEHYNVSVLSVYRILI